MYLARELTDQTLPAIGRAFGGRNHTTVMHACRRTAERIASDPEAYETVRRLTERARRHADDVRRAWTDSGVHAQAMCTPASAPQRPVRASLCTPSTPLMTLN